MKFLVSCLIVLTLGVVIALVARDDPGYILINYHGWSVETSLVFLVVVTIVTFLVAYYLVRFLANSRALPRRITRWHGQRRATKARASLNKGLLAFAEGRWDIAERTLLKHIAYSDSPLLNYLTAAQAAHRLGAKQRRDRYLKLAQQFDTGNDDIVVNIKVAELLLEQQQYEQAQATLRRIYRKAPQHSQVLRLLRQLYIEIGDWERLRELIPKLKKQNLFSVEELTADQVLVYSGLLDNAAHEEGTKTLNEVWQRVPASLTSNASLLAHYARHLIDHGAAQEAIPLLRKAIDRNWSDLLVDLFGQADGGAAYSPSQLAAAEAWLRDHPDNPVLLLTLGRLAARNQMPSKARRYYEMSIAQSPHPVTYRELGRLLEQLGEQSEAVAYFDKSFALLERASRAGLSSSSRPQLISTGTTAQQQFLPAQ